MFIKSVDGEIIIEEEVLSPHLKLSEFKESKLFSKVVEITNNKPWCSYNLKDKKIKIDGKIYYMSIMIYFKDQKINSMDIVLNEKSINKSDWSTWDEKSEHSAKLFYDDLLRKEYGEPPYLYPWGEIISDYDERDGTSSIFVRYYDNEK